MTAPKVKKAKWAQPVRRDLTKPQEWLAHHREHGRPYYDAKIGEWHTWRCACGQKFTFNDAQRDASPKDYAL